jgi:hypothetical protein
VCRLPFIRMLASPERTNATALSAASGLCTASTSRNPPMSTPACSAAARILSTGPTRTGSIMPSCAASTAAMMAASLQGCATAVGRGTTGLTRATKSRELVAGLHRYVGRGSTIFVAGAITSATPVATTSPSWLTQRQSRITVEVAARFSRTATVAVIVSSTTSGFTNRSS